LDPILENSDESLSGGERTAPPADQSSATDISQPLTANEDGEEKPSVTGMASIKAEVEVAKKPRKKRSSRKKYPAASDQEEEEASDSSDGESEGYYYVKAAAEDLNTTGLYEAYIRGYHPLANNISYLPPCNQLTNGYAIAQEAYST
jgi:hypothetical protein